jgi:6,7-dimethyl-8-ribityllumazine synthase
MASKGNTALDKGIPQLTDAFVVIVKTEWNARITDELEAGCKRMLEMNRIASETYIVPGAFEIPFAIKTIYSAPVFITLL